MSKSYKRARREEYPELCCQMGAVYLALKTLFAETDTAVPAEVQAWFDNVEAVKAAHPKPDGDDNAFFQQPRTEN